MSLRYYTNLVKGFKLTPPEQIGLQTRFSAHPDLIKDSIRILLGIYWQLKQARKFPPNVNPEDIDEGIDTVVAQLPKLLLRWDPNRGRLVTFLYINISSRLKRAITKLHNQTSQYLTNVFDEPVDPDELNGLTDDIAVGNEDMSDLPINDIIYSDEPQGLLQPEVQARLDDTVALLEALADGSITPQRYAGSAHCTVAQAYRRRENLEKLFTQNEV